VIPLRYRNKYVSTYPVIPILFIIVACTVTLLSCEKREAQKMPNMDRSREVGLDQYRWKNRIVLIFTPSSVDASYLKQKKELAGKAHELGDRDIIIFELLESGKSTIDKLPLTDEQQSYLRKEFEVPDDDFTFFLIGKDGTAKLRSNETVSMDNLFTLIDSMPMRREEMRRKSSKP